ncbi:MAG: hypothetical protein K8R67_07115 [Desulfobacteraceae bacterium]|nr:hypothetical protein [Desulfobacteraceae bacterium]
MERIFQHYKGEIKAFSQLYFSTAKAVVNSLDNSVIVLWLNEKYNGVWYRIFIDGTYCGIDQFSEDKSSEDIDDGIITTNYSDWFQGKKVLKAKVFSDQEAEAAPDLIFSLKFAASECQLVYLSKYDKCELRFFDLNS